jgi:hypothetical protein
MGKLGMLLGQSMAATSGLSQMVSAMTSDADAPYSPSGRPSGS